MVKQVVPAGDGGKFDLKIDGAVFDNSGAGFGDGGSTGFQQVAVGSRTVSELGHTGTSLGDYVSKVDCDSSKGSSDPGTSHTFSVSYGDKVTCTITNQRKPEIKVVKQVVPAGDGGKFDLKIDGAVFDNSGAGFGDGGSTGFQQVAVGSRTVSELGHTGTSLGDYVSKVDCDSSKGSSDPGTSHTFSVSYGDKVTCTITNQRKPEIKVVKQVVPAGDGGKFDLKIDGAVFDNSGAGFGDGGSTGFQQVAVGSRTVSELGHTGTSLGDYVSKVDCDSSKGSSDPGTSHTFSVSYGDKVTCTITTSASLRSRWSSRLSRPAMAGSLI